MKKYLIGLVLLTFGASVSAEECAAVVESNDMMQFNVNAMTVPASCESYTVTLKHVGQIPKQAMGHNWVLSTTANVQEIVNLSFGAGLENNYLPPGDDRVLAATKVIGGGEEDSVTFDVSMLSADESYTFFCSFPGHYAVMKGTLTVK